MSLGDSQLYGDNISGSNMNAMVFLYFFFWFVFSFTIDSEIVKNALKLSGMKMRDGASVQMFGSKIEWQEKAGWAGCIRSSSLSTTLQV